MPLDSGNYNLSMPSDTNIYQGGDRGSGSSYQTPQQEEAPEYDQSPSSSGGSDMISSIIASGVDTGALITEGIFFYKEQEIAEKAAEEARRWAERQRQDVLRQQRIQNQLARDKFDLSKSTFDFGRMRWGKEFALTKAQWNAQMDDRKIKMKQSGFDRLMGNVVRSANNNMQLKDSLLGRAAA